MAAEELRKLERLCRGLPMDVSDEEVNAYAAEELRKLIRSNRGLPMDASDEEVRAYDAEQHSRKR